MVTKKKGAILIEGDLDAADPHRQCHTIKRQVIWFIATVTLISIVLEGKLTA